MSSKTTPTITMVMMILAVLMIANNDRSITEAVDTTATSDYCGEDHYGNGDVYGDVLTGLLHQLADTTGNAYQYTNDLSATDDNSGETVYGHAKCSETLEPEECTQCVTAAKDYLLTNCALSIFAFVEMVDCDMKYDDSPFQE